MEKLSTVLFKTPLWVYAIFVYLLWRGVIATKDRVTTLPQLFIIPSILVIINAFRLIKTPMISAWLVYGLAIVSGALLGFIIAGKKPIQIQTETQYLILPGSLQPLIFLMAVFGSRYTSGYLQATNPMLAQEYSLYLLALSALITGIFWGHRARCIQYYYSHIK